MMSGDGVEREECEAVLRVLLELYAPYYVYVLVALHQFLAVGVSAGKYVDLVAPALQLLPEV
jgi:hypothetical protein